MVINVGLLKSGDYHGVEEDIRAVRRATRGNTVLKVIIETALLTQDEKVHGLRAVEEGRGGLREDLHGLLRRRAPAWRTSA